MYSEQFKESLALVEASREKNIALEPQRMTAKQKEKVTDLYLKIIPIMKQYNIDRGQIRHG